MSNINNIALLNIWGLAFSSNYVGFDGHKFALNNLKSSYIKWQIISWQLVGKLLRRQDSSFHVIEAVWMKGVWSWAYHIQAIHSQSPILWSAELLGQLEKRFWCMKVWWMKINVCQMKGLILHPLYESICVGFSYNWLIFISFQVWSSKRAWRWLLVLLVLPFRRKR